MTIAAFLRELYVYSHADSFAADASVYILANDGAVLQAEGGSGLIKNHVCVEPPGGWDVGPLPLAINIDGYSKSGILCSKRVALGLRELTASFLSGEL